MQRPKWLENLRKNHETNRYAGCHDCQQIDTLLPYVDQLRSLLFECADSLQWPIADDLLRERALKLLKSEDPPKGSQ